MGSERLRMTPGPTEIPDAIRDRMAEPMPNPDVEPDYFESYRELLDKLERIFRADAAGAPTGTGDAGMDLVVLGGEGILGLEAAVASLVGEGDRVLCLSNGTYGDGFADFVESNGGEAVTCRVPDDETLSADAVADELADADYDVATMVHCETPTGTLNGLEEILELLEDRGVVSIVDAVSSLGGAPVPTESIDVCIGGSQKCFSAPPGLTICSISDRAWNRMESVENATFYTDLEPWRTAVEDEWFPYTHLTANLAGLDAAADLLLEEGMESVFERHEAAARRCRERAAELGLEPFPADENDCSPTVTALAVDDAGDLQRTILEEHGVALATGLGDHEDDVLRIGHMGHNARVERVDRAMDALAAVLE
ncbi:pyridoxal-phosphate-dependent aminotransferase family protein [Natrarchaeobius chitinivorans]|uniref:Alanine--glyoxylate aminotransferase family protein n=1 Tax=Natrarchaeobius chitinivorans TaxID=1679083 RepID=A0A3N6LWV8_NATCH|nr:alanine--glyoxylate aminotransferase family protein [Natrarchaeobius chitinivorans]RQG93397.1 alanine--glyoxylate aminotransferase family protein [Natrarchaeobius chitinivorans]